MAKPQRVVAGEDASLGARVVQARALHYSAGENRPEDRPAHVRAGSALGWFGGRIAVIQDDANFVALVDPRSDSVDALALAPEAGGVRCFDDVRGNKAHKLDLEACIVHADRLIAFGSGSTPNRERLVVVDGSEKTARVVEAAALYTELRSNVEFSGSELNVEGAAVLDETRLVLLQRGNGAARGALRPVNSIGEISLAELIAFVDRGGSEPAPALTAVTQYELGTIDGVRLTFTDAVARGSDLLFLAAAEASPDVVRDGVVVGVALGIVDSSGTARWTRLLTREGTPFNAKAEGLLLDRTLADRAFAVIDLDDPERATELVEIELSGF